MKFLLAVGSIKLRVQVILCLSIFYPILIFCQCDSVYWSTDPADNLQVSTWGLSPEACSDGDGGVFIAWESFDYYYSHVYLQRVDKCGFVQWDPPLDLVEMGGLQGEFRIAPDGFGGALVLYDVLTPVDTIDGEPIYEGDATIQRVDSLGNKLWGEEGVLVSLDSTDQWIIDLVSDDEGAIVIFRTGTIIFGDTIRWHIQRISANGERMWGDSGLLIPDMHQYSNLLIVGDGEGGAIIYYTTPHELRFQRIDMDGNTLWTTITPGGYSHMISDEAEGAIVSGTKYLGDSYRHVKANRITSYGSIQWGDEGIVIDDSIRVRNRIVDMSIDDCGVRFAWVDNVDSLNTILTQMVEENGEVLWGDNKRVSLYPSSKGGVRLTSSDDCNIIYVWNDFRDGTLSDIYTQKIDSTGNRIWSDDDVAISSRDHSMFKVVSDSHSGAIVVWSDEPLNGIFAQQISVNGNLGEVITDMEITGSNSLTDQFQLNQNYPNPFNPTTTILFDLPEPGEVELVVYDILGREIVTLIDQELMAGYHRVVWNASQVSSGIYFYRLTSEQGTKSRKLVVLK